MIFQIIAITILLTFYGCYFIKMTNQKKKGIQTDQLGRGKEGFSKFIETTMKIATVIVPIVEVVSICINTSYLPLWARWLGAILGVLGVVSFSCAVITMRDSWRAGVSTTDKTELITSGIYQISRNPAFLGFDLVYIGILMMFFNWGLWIVSVFAALMFHLQIVNVEEDFLIATFGDEYLNYRKEVNRYLGRKRDKKDEFYSPMPTIMSLILIVSIIGCVIFTVLYKQLKSGWLYSCAITFGMFSYHMIIRFISPVILQLIFRKKYNYKSKWFQTNSWERKLYQILKIKKWKVHVMTYNPKEFSLKLNSSQEIVNNICHAEVVHELIMILSFASILFAIPLGAFAVFLITAILAALLDSIFVMIQRYNRPRIIKIVEKTKI